MEDKDDGKSHIVLLFCIFCDAKTFNEDGICSECIKNGEVKEEKNNDESRCG